MNFWAAAEVFQAAFPVVNRIRRRVETFLNSALVNSSLGSLEGRLRYVPIVMPPGMREHYPARSLLRKEERIYDCAPQLNYAVFVEGSFEDQLREYLGGIAQAAPHLADLGASPQQIEEFRAIIETAVDRILAEGP